MTKRQIISLFAVVLGFLLLSTTSAQTGSPDFNVILLTADGSLVTLRSSNPSKVIASQKVTGLAAGEKLVGIDFRPSQADNKPEERFLYAVSRANNLYKIVSATGAATLVGALTTALSGDTFGVDFNPVPDRIRIVNNWEQNLRANPDDAKNVVDKPLNYKSGDTNSGQNPNIAAAAYTNNYAGTKATTLYVIDSTQDILATQNPPNDGVINTVGLLGVKITDNVGFDIVTTRTVVGEGEAKTTKETNYAFAAMQPERERTSRLYSIDLTNGSAKMIGKLAVKGVVVGLAIIP